MRRLAGPRLRRTVGCCPGAGSVFRSELGPGAIPWRFLALDPWLVSTQTNIKLACFWGLCQHTLSRCPNAAYKSFREKSLGTFKRYLFSLLLVACAFAIAWCDVTTVAASGCMRSAAHVALWLIATCATRRRSRRCIAARCINILHHTQ